MNKRRDPELEDTLRDPELLRLAAMLSSAHTPEPPLDDAFRSALRRQLMAKAWEAGERRGSFWRFLSAPPRVAWVGAAAVVALIALVVVQTQSGNGSLVVNSPQSGGTQVALQQPILVSFNQPMDHQSTEQAVQIVPATAVRFIWKDDNTLYVQPTSGNLAPNTQYQVTVGPTARTKAGHTLSAPTGFTFVTQPVQSTPVGQPSPTPRSGSLNGERRLAAIGSGSAYAPQWSPDSSIVYFVGGDGALVAISLSSAPPRTLVPDGVSLPALSPGGDRIAFARGGVVQVLSLTGGRTIPIHAALNPMAIAWVNDRLYWANAEGVFMTVAGGGAAGGGAVKVISSPDPSGSFVSIAPGGAHAAFVSGGTLELVDLTSGAAAQLGSGGATTFQGWSPDGSKILHDGAIADMTGQTIARLPAGDPAWSASGRIIVGSDSELIEFKTDGSGTTQLASGAPYRLPRWAPDNSTLVFVRGGDLWSGSAGGGGSHPPQGSPIAQATAAVDAFMDARLAGDADKANSYLDDSGRAGYAQGGLSLIPKGDLGFRRYYILTAEVDPSAPNTVRFVVRLIFGHGGALERSLMEETFIVRRASDSDPFLIDRVIGGVVRDLGHGPVVVAVKITPNQIAVTFDSDLRPATIAGMQLQDGQGNVVNGSISYADRTITITGLQLQPGAAYRLVVLPTVQDIGGRSVAGEYDLDLVGPSTDAQSSIAVTATPTPNS